MKNVKDIDLFLELKQGKGSAHLVVPGLDVMLKFDTDKLAKHGRPSAVWNQIAGALAQTAHAVHTQGVAAAEAENRSGKRARRVKPKKAKRHPPS